MTTPVRVLIADDQALVRSGFAMVLSVEDDIEVVGQVANGAEALAALAATDVDVVLMDVQMPVMDGIAATQRVVGEDLAKVIILTTFDREDYLFDALAAGASGFLLKNADPDDLVDAIRAVAEGHALLAPEVTVKVIARLVSEGRGPAAVPAGQPARPADPATARAVASLTAREREVLGLMAEGLSNAEIAERLFLGESTVKTHVSHILTKTDSRDRVRAVVLAHRIGLVGAS
ncbi:response regulator transcription factor [Georgenia daeguensis]|uniref:Response regulator transcription factor n=1 Tax=Georgenia daeguensis TaxID=908355 RepID=A0ABP6UK46_9MICO